MVSHANFCDDNVMAKSDSDITKLPGMSILLQTSTQTPEMNGVTFFRLWFRSTLYDSCSDSC